MIERTSLASYAQPNQTTTLFTQLLDSLVAAGADSSFLARAGFGFADALMLKGDPLASDSVRNQVVMPRDPSRLARASQQLSQLHRQLAGGSTRSSPAALDSITQLLRDHEDPFWQGRFLLAKARHERIVGRYSEAIAAALAADSISHVHGLLRTRSRAGSVLFKLFFDTHDLDRAREAKQAYERIANFTNPAWVRANRQLMDYYLDMATGEFALADRRLDSAGHLYDSLGIRQATNNLVQSRAMLRGAEQRWAEAQALWRQVREHRLAYGADPSYADYWIGITFRGLDQYDSAAVYLERAYDEALERNVYEHVHHNAYALYQTRLWRGKHEEALKWYKLHRQYLDSVSSAKYTRDRKVLLAQYDARVRAQEAELATARADRAQARNSLYGVGLVLSIALACVILFAFRQNRKIAAQRLTDSEEARMRLQNKLQQQSLEQDAQEAELARRLRELSEQSLTLVQKDALLKSLETHLSTLGSGATAETAKTVATLKRTLRRDPTRGTGWEAFVSSFREGNKELTQTLQAKHPGLTPNDFKLFALLVSNPSNKELAKALTISEEGAKKARYRLRKKLGLGRGEKISDYLAGLDLRLQTEAS